jgi:two-component system, NtrC family, response regulator HydG
VLTLRRVFCALSGRKAGFASCPRSAGIHGSRSLRRLPACDIPSLVKHYTAKATNPYFESSLIEFTEDALATLAAYHWPGNLTELLQVVSKIAATTEARVVTSQQLPMRLREIKDWPKLADYLAGQQRQYIDLVLRACRGDTALAAKVLGTDVQPP